MSEPSSRPFEASGGWDVSNEPETAPVEPAPAPVEAAPPAVDSFPDEPEAPSGGEPDGDPPDEDRNEERPPTESTPKLRTLVTIGVGVFAVLVLGGAGLIALLSGGGASATDNDGVSHAAIVTAPTVVPAAPSIGPSMWRQPVWADADAGMTAFELTANGDVPFANGRIRPTLGVGCADGQAEVHLTTGGTAIIDPQTSGHTVRMRLDGADEQVEHWNASDDQRTLFATDPRGVAESLATADTLQLVFTHYLAGPVTVDFSLRGVDEVVQSTAEACKWEDPAS